MRKSIIHSERAVGLDVSAATVIFTTPTGFETTPEGEAFKAALLAELKYKAVFANAPAGGVMTIVVKSGSTILGTATVNASAQIQAGTVVLNTDNLNAGSVLTVEAEVTTLYSAGATVDIDAQIYFKEPFNIGCS